MKYLDNREEQLEFEFELPIEFQLEFGTMGDLYVYEGYDCFGNGYIILQNGTHIFI